MLLVAPAVGTLLWALDRRRHVRLVERIGPRVQALAEERSVGRRTFRRRAFTGSLFFAGLAVLGVDLGSAHAAASWSGPDLVLCLDVSRSMEAQDVVPSRLARAKAEISAFGQVAAGARVGLVEFAGAPRLRAPLTEDLASLALLAEEADPTDVSRGGTDLGAAIDEAAALLESGRVDDRRASAVVLLTDGEDHGGRGFAAAQRALARGHRVEVLGLGTALGAKIPLADTGGRGFLLDAHGTEVVSRLDPQSLEALARAGGGTFTPADREPGTLARLYASELRSLASTAANDPAAARRQEGFPWPIGVAFLLALVDLAVADRRVVRTRVPTAPARPVRARASGRRPRSAPRAASTAVSLALVPLLLLLAGCDRTAAGRRAWAAGRVDEAGRAFAASAVAAGDGASAELLYDRALAALALHHGDEALAAAKAAAARGGPAFRARYAFVEGSVAYRDSHDADAEATRLGGNQQAALHALTRAEDAVAFWQAAAASRADWPEARRNVERGTLWLEHLRTTKGGKPKPKPSPKPPPGRGPKPKPPEPTKPPPSEPAIDARTETRELSPAGVLRVLETLRVREQEKLRLRRAEAKAHPSGGRDW